MWVWECVGVQVWWMGKYITEQLRECVGVGWVRSSLGGGEGTGE